MLLSNLREFKPQIGGQFEGEAPFRVIYIIWFMGMWMTIIIGIDMVVHDKAFNDQPSTLKLFAL
jgi:hypothetical protein